MRNTPEALDLVKSSTVARKESATKERVKLRILHLYMLFNIYYTKFQKDQNEDKVAITRIVNLIPKI